MLKLAEIYVTFQGEVNVEGIGAPAIFVRLAGCHLRCYKKTLGTLCDTPHFLEKKSGEDVFAFDIIERAKLLRADTGVNLITLTGGDPLWNDEGDVYTLLQGLVRQRFIVSVETSGIDHSIAPYRSLANVHWVVDYKLKSAGIPKGDTRNVLLMTDAAILTKEDFIKFVVYDEEDYLEMSKAVNVLWFEKGTKARIAVGPYWGGKISPFELFNKMKDDSLLAYTTMNFQVHKMAISSDYAIPTEKLQI